MSKQKPLSPTQADLLKAIRRGVKVHYMEYLGRHNPNPYYFRNDTHKRCTAAVDALVAKGFLEIYDQNYGKHKVRLKSR